jgi:hypothetical protein
MFSCFRNFGQFENFFCPVSSSKLWRWKKKNLSVPTISGALLTWKSVCWVDQH